MGCILQDAVVFPCESVGKFLLTVLRICWGRAQKLYYTMFVIPIGPLCI